MYFNWQRNEIKRQYARFHPKKCMFFSKLFKKTSTFSLVDNSGLKEVRTVGDDAVNVFRDLAWFVNGPYLDFLS